MQGASWNYLHGLSLAIVAPRSGVYRVHHYAHRMPHLVIVLAGTVLPKCKHCADKVQFVPVAAGEPIESDVDFVHDFAA